MKKTLYFILVLGLITGSILITKNLTARKYITSDISMPPSNNIYPEMVTKTTEEKEIGLIDVCKNIDGDQITIPEEMEVNDNGDCTAKIKVVKETIIIREPAKQDDSPAQTNPPTETPEQSTYYPARNFKSDGTLDVSKYTQVTVNEYYTNPKAYLNKPIKITGAVVADFNQSSNNQTNYISIIDGNDFSENPNRIMVEIESDSNYTQIAQNIKRWDHVLIFSFGASDAEFTIVGNGEPYTDYEKMVVSDAVYKCTDNCIYTYSVGSKLVFSKKSN